ncbi:MAG: GIY-YIG nuclease family protein [Henriciella sp.]|nr:GIY-YIG nuclease family protein [Henriciella sp.]
MNGDEFNIVYVVTNDAMPGLVKIGKTTQSEARARLNQLFNTSVPFPFKLEFACRVVNCDEVERALHVAFAPHRVNPRREFFDIDPAQAIAILKLLHTEETTDELAASSDPESLSDAAAGQQYSSKRRPSLNFEEMGIPIGAELYSTADDTVVTVCEPKKVLMNGDAISLTAATRTVLGIEYSVAPTGYWTYNGKSLNTIYDETYPLFD